MVRISHVIWVSAALFAVAVLSGCGGGGGGGNPVIPFNPSSDLIAYSSINGGVYQINLMKGDGSSQHMLTTSQSNIPPMTSLSPTLTADGSRWVAFTSNDATAHSQINLVNTANSGNLVTISNGGDDDSYPAWSPDGNKIAYIQAHLNSDSTTTVSIDYVDVTNVANPRTSVQVATVEPGADYGSVCWIDNSHIAISSNAGSTSDNVFSADITKPNSQLLQQLTFFTTDNMSIDGLSYNANQFAMAYSANGVNGQLAVFSANGSPSTYTTLSNDTLNQFDDIGPTWSSSSTRIYYFSSAPDTTPVSNSTTYSIYAYNLKAPLTSSNPQRLTTNASSSWPSTRRNKR